MRRHRSIGLLAGTLLALVLVGSAAAKTAEDQAVIALDTPHDAHAGAPVQVGVLITRSDGTAIRGEDVTFQLVKNGGIGLVTAHATEATMGHYVATLTLPEKGAWTVVVTAVGAGNETQVFHAGDLLIGAPLPTATPAEPAAPVAPSWLLVAVLLLVLAAGGAGAWILTLRRRSAVAPDRA
jgi:hypothetical protein